VFRYNIVVHINGTKAYTDPNITCYFYAYINVPRSMPLMILDGLTPPDCADISLYRPANFRPLRVQYDVRRRGHTVTVY